MATTTGAKDNSLKGYCLWLVPDETSAPVLQNLIKHLASIEPGPVFMPHITLLSPKSALKEDLGGMTAALQRAASTRNGPMEITLHPPAPGTFYYQCVLAPVEVSPRDELLALRSAAEKECNEFQPKFFPHLSLLYGDISDERKAELCAEAARQLPFPVKFVVKEAVVVDVNGTAEGWKVVARVPL